MHRYADSFIAFASNTPKIQSLLCDVFGTENRCLTEIHDLKEMLLRKMEVPEFSESELDKINAYLATQEKLRFGMFQTMDKKSRYFQVK